MSSIFDQIVDTASSALANRDPASVTSEIIRNTVLSTISYLSSVNQAELSVDPEAVARRLEEQFDITMNLGTIFSAEDYRPWLAERRVDLEWFFWSRYQRHLRKQGFPPRVLKTMDTMTDRILDHLEDPAKEGQWKRRGMVVGHVQSGKTANYTGLICKAADAGYRVIIVLAGLLNSLRNQTQIRIDEGFIGVDTSTNSDGHNHADRFVGVGLLAADRIRRPASFTSRVADFKKATAKSVSLNFSTLNEASIIVVKKNSNTLKSLTSWIESNNESLQAYPMLLIDDEADHASINTKKSGEDVTAINKRIRELLKLFQRSSYVGYTATPFANIFIDPDSETEMLDQDLFPRDFIISLDPPSNYIGPPQVFGESAAESMVRDVIDAEDYIPVRHKIDHVPESLPPSLENAIRAYILSRTIRDLRGSTSSHSSMMINVSRFTRVQSEVHLLVDDYLKVLVAAIRNHGKLSSDEAIRCSSAIKDLNLTWQSEYSNLDDGLSWEQIQGALNAAASRIDVIEVNSSHLSEPLDYSRKNHPNGRNVIAIGGLSLSRGLTLEGLTISYFLRNSIMYDTLMQMGRWFGYRDGYADLCRIFMTPLASSWYQHISEVVTELRAEFNRMKNANMTPSDFGLCVKSHPDSLIVTARNKMRSGRSVTREVSLFGRLIETAVVHAKPQQTASNRRATERLVQKVSEVRAPEEVRNCLLWSRIPGQVVEKFLQSFENHPASQLTEPGPVLEYISGALGPNRLWDVVLVGIGKDKTSSPVQVGGHSIYLQSRSVDVDSSKTAIVFPKHRLASRGLERMGLSEEQIQMAQASCDHANPPDRIYRPFRDRPLLMLHLIRCSNVKGFPNLSFESPIPAWGISFPGEAGTGRPKNCVKYIVNSVWWDQMYSSDIEEDEDLSDE